MTMNNNPWRGVAELLADVMQRSVPADAALRRLFGSRSHAGGRPGQRQRTQVADAVYGILRHPRSLDYLLGADPAVQATDRLAMWLYRYDDQSTSAAAAAAGTAAGYRAEAIQALTERLTASSDPARALEKAAPAVQLDLPDWLYQELVTQLPATELEQFASTIKRPAPLDLRVNTLRCSPARARQALAAEGIPLEPGHWSPVALRTAQQRPLADSKAWREGWVEVQDEGSQLIAPLLEPRRGETIVDLCAGAGGKSLHLAALMANRGHIHAFDTSRRRLEQLKQRCRRAGVDTVRPVLIADQRADAVQRLRGKIDRVLVDAPCSGSGTLRRRPEVGWQSHDLSALTAVQDALLDAAAALLRPGGRLVYATCSLLAAENQDRATAFEQRHRDFTPLNLAPILKRRNSSLEVGEETRHLQLYPHRHGCDGFFAAVWERNA